MATTSTQQYVRFAVLMLLAFVFAPQDALSRGLFSVEKVYNDRGNWTVGINIDRKACHMFMTYEDDTTVEVGSDMSQGGLSYYIVFLNPRWAYAEGAQYKVRIRYNGRSTWNGDGYGMKTDGGKGVTLEGVKPQLIDEFAGMLTMRLYIDGDDYGSYNLSGTQDGLNKMINCIDDIDKGYISIADIEAAYNKQHPEEASPGSNQPSEEPSKPEAADDSAGDGKKEEWYSTGTGFFINSDGYLITNAHVVEGCPDALFRLSNNEYMPATIVARETNNDLAILKGKDKAPHYAKFRGQPQIRMGDAIVVFGYPLTDTLSSTGNFTTGLVSSLAGPKDDVTKIQISAPLQSGNSGGPVADQTGHVVAVVVQKMDLQSRGGDDSNVEVVQNVNFAIKAGVAQFFMDANQIHYEVEAPGTKMDTADEAALMKDYSAQVICKPEQ